MNNTIKQNIYLKAKILSLIREFFEKENFIEVDTPCLVKSPDPSPFNEVFETITANKEKLFLTPSPEFFIKKILALGIENVYQITKSYRDMQEDDPIHLKEFTMLEWYRTSGDYLGLMGDCENLVSFIIEGLVANIKYQISNFKSNSNFQKPWEKISCKEAFKKYANIDLEEFINPEKTLEICKEKGYQVDKDTKWEEMYHQVFLNEVEPKLPNDVPFFLYDYPAPLAALSQIKKENPNFAERMELYINGIEIGNGYSELTDWEEQEKRLKADIETRKEKGMKVFEYDKELVEAIKSGIPKTAGIAVGIDRLIMVLLGETDIRKITPFAI